jgi:aminoglycoside phosphotransferase (APT) family kinase protein
MAGRHPACAGRVGRRSYNANLQGKPDTADLLLRQLCADGVVRSSGASMVSLAGGVSSEIYRVEDDGDVFVVKRALPKLKVRDDWTADVLRNACERRYLEYVGRFLPQSVPRLRNAGAGNGYFVMEYFGAEFRNWKELLLRKCFDPLHAAAAGSLIGVIHRTSTGDPDAVALFAGQSCFHQLRLDPYLMTTGRRHPQLESLFDAEVRRLTGTSECLVHGDFSPKNILIGQHRIVILDCEAAWYGDPAFDVCFLLSHLFLKAVYHRHAEPLAELVRTFWSAYVLASGCAVEDRVPRLLLMLLLARMDGKSPVEYLDESKREFVRGFVADHLPQPPTFSVLVDTWFSAIACIFNKR